MSINDNMHINYLLCVVIYLYPYKKRLICAHVGMISGEITSIQVKHSLSPRNKFSLGYCRFFYLHIFLRIKCRIIPCYSKNFLSDFWAISIHAMHSVTKSTFLDAVFIRGIFSWVHISLYIYLHWLAFNTCLKR